MSARPRKIWLLSIATLAIASISALGAESEQGTSLQDAKREFDALGDTTKSLPGVKDQSVMPSLSGIHLSPEDAVDVPVGSTARKGGDATAKPGRGQNWLLDAMLKEPKSTKSGSTKSSTRDDADEDEKSLEPFQKLILEQMRGDTAKAETMADAAKAEKELSDAVVNPLTDFMSAWISPRDHALLLPEKSADTPAIPRFNAPDTVGVFTGGEIAKGDRSFLPNNTPANPYLDSIVSPANSIGAPRPAADPTPAPVVNPIQMPSAGHEKPRAQDTLAPIIAKPEEDARYFPQLKRF